MRGTKIASKMAIAIFFCAVMVLVAGAPMTSAQGEHLIVKGAKGPNASAVTWEYRTGADNGQWVGHIVNNGLRSMVIDVADVTSGTPIDVLHQRIRFAVYPTNEVDTKPALMGANKVFSITATPNGPQTTSATVTDVFTIIQPPVAAFSIVSNVDGVVSVDASASTGSIVEYGWDWGDATIGTGVTATHTYTASGTYLITLTVVDNLGVRDSDSQSVTVVVPMPNQKPVASFTATTAAGSLMVSVDGSASTDSDGTVVAWSWNWGDVSAAGSGVLATHTYAASGTYTITLTVTDDDGAVSDPVSKDVTVSNVMPSTVTYTVSEIFQNYLKYDTPAPYDYSKLGHWTSTSGLNPWFVLRQSGYAEWTVRNTYPYILALNPYSPNTSPVTQAGNVVQSFYRLAIEAKNLPKLGTDNDPIFVPILSGNAALPGGNVAINWYGTYMYTQEMIDYRTSPGKHYANTYYGVPYNYIGLPRSTADDGYWQELQATMHFDRVAAIKFLGLPGTGVLKDEFTALKPTIDAAWLDDWMNEGGGVYDIYTSYDYSDDIRVVYVTLDPTGNTNPEQLDLRFWSISWGNEALMSRYLEATGINQWMQSYMEEFYINLTMHPTTGDGTLRAVQAYYMTATQDQSAPTKAAWMMEAMSIDYGGNLAPQHLGYNSPYNPYDPDQHPTVTRMYYNPGSTTFGQRTSVGTAPLQWNLVAGEKLIVKLPTGTAGGITPYVGTSDVLSATKMAEYNSHYVSGAVSLGTGYPTNLNNWYDSATKTLTLIGPWSAPRNVNPSDSTVLESGCPCIIMDIG